MPVVLQENPETISRASTGRFYRPELDALRFLAFFMVYIHHVAPLKNTATLAKIPFLAQVAVLSIGRAGFYGVDLFLILSAYLICTLLRREEDALGRVDVRGFYIRRILRIWPLYFLFLGAIAPVLATVIHWPALPAVYAIGFLAFSGNWTFALLGRIQTFTTSLWSVSVEEQFYLLWPLFSWRQAKRRRTVLAGLAVLSIATAALMSVYHCKEEAFSFNTFVRLLPICLGALLAGELRGRMPGLRASSRTLLMLAGCAAFLVVGYFGSNWAWGAVWSYPVAALASGSVLLSVLGCHISRFWEYVLQPFSYLGRISYGLYVFHGAVLATVEHYVPGSNAVRILGSLAITIAAASISYAAIERPFLKLKDRFAHVQSRPV